MASERDLDTLLGEYINPSRKTRTRSIVDENSFRISKFSCYQGLPLLTQSVSSNSHDRQRVAFESFRREHLYFGMKLDQVPEIQVFYSMVCGSKGGSSRT